MSLGVNPTLRVIPTVQWSGQRFPAQAGPVFLFYAAVFCMFCILPGSAQQQKNPAPPKYDVQTETKAKGLVDEVKLLEFGPRKDFVELIVKDGDNKDLVYVCPKPFQDEIGIAFSKGDQIEFTGSKIKQDAGDVILAREVVKGTDRLMFRDDKGNPVWDWKSGK